MRDYRQIQEIFLKMVSASPNRIEKIDSHDLGVAEVADKIEASMRKLIMNKRRRSKPKNSK